MTKERVLAIVNDKCLVPIPIPDKNWETIKGWIAKLGEKKAFEKFAFGVGFAIEEEIKEAIEEEWDD